MVGSLVEHHAAAVGSVQFLRATRTKHEVRVVSGVNHPHRPVSATGNQLAGLDYRLIEAVAGADDHLFAILGHRLDNRRRIAGADRHRFFNQNMFTSGQGLNYIVAVHFMRGGNVDRLDVGIGVQLLCGANSLISELLFKRLLLRLTAGGRPGQLNPVVIKKRRQCQHKAAAQPYHTELDRFDRRRLTHKSTPAS